MVEIGKIRIAVTMVLVLFIGISGCYTPGGRSAGNVVDDATITTKVKAKLFKDEVLSGFAVSVETFQGEVTLTGGVDDQRQKSRATVVAESVEGVTGVNNLLKVK